jgi:hypothetical protein
MQSHYIRAFRLLTAGLTMSSLCACVQAQNGTLLPASPASIQTQRNAPSEARRGFPPRGGEFNGAYTGTLEGFQLNFKGTGRASFLHASTENGYVHEKCSGIICQGDGSATLTSSRNSANAITLSWTQYHWYGDFCHSTFKWSVASGTGKFAQARGSGSVTFTCPGSHLYSDTWTGTVSF